MPKNDTLKRLGMQKEFNNWVKQIQTLPRTFEDIKIGHRFEIFDKSSFVGWTGVVTNKEGGETIISTLTSPEGEVIKGIRTHKSTFEGHIRFI